MIEITPKIFAPTFLSFLVRRSKGGNGVPRKTMLKAFFIGVALCFIALTLGKHELASKGIQERLAGAVIATIVFLGVVISIIIPAGYLFLWPNKWIYEDNKVNVIKRFSSLTLSYHQLDKIVLESPYCANLVFKDPNSNFLKITNWYGSSRYDWLIFIKFLDGRISINNKIGVIYRDGFKFVEKKMNSPEEAYDFVEKMFPKLTFEHLNNKIT